MQTITEREVKIHWSSILTQIEKRGERFLIFREGKPVADLIPHEQKEEIFDTMTDEDMSKQEDSRQEELEPLKRIAGIVLPTKKLEKASMPKIKVTGKPLSQIIIEDRR